MPTDKSQKETASPQKCFIIMPISDQQGYAEGHFSRVYEYIIKPSCKAANVIPRRADETSGTNLIQLEILEQLLAADIAICDLSSRNPNVMFELGIRQAFDMPTVLIKDHETPSIFDISGLRYLEYDKNLEYGKVQEAQQSLTAAINETLAAKGKQVNSLIQMLSMSRAIMPELTDNKEDLRNNLIITQLEQISKNQQIMSKSIADLQNKNATPSAIENMLKETIDHYRPSDDSLQKATSFYKWSKKYDLKDTTKE